MSAEFNPYAEILKLKGPVPPNHYELLGLAPFEADQDLIGQAAPKQSAKVRPYQIGAWSKEALRLLDEIGQAYACLADKTSKQEYDAQLRSRLPLQSVRPTQLSSQLDKKVSLKDPSVEPSSNTPSDSDRPQSLGAKGWSIVWAGVLWCDGYLKRLLGEDNVVLHYAVRLGMVVCVLGYGFWTLFGTPASVPSHLAQANKSKATAHDGKPEQPMPPQTTPLQKTFVEATANSPIKKKSIGPRRPFPTTWVLHPMSRKVSEQQTNPTISTDFPNFMWKMICTTRVQNQNDLMLVEVTGNAQGIMTGVPQNLTNSPAHESFPAWSPDGTELAYLSNQDRWTHIYKQHLKTQLVQQLTTGNYNHRLPIWSPNGKRLAYFRFTGVTDLFTMLADGTDLVNLTNTPTTWESDPGYSPDGNLLAYIARTGRYFQLGTMSPQGQDATIFDLPVELIGYVYPCWLPDGNQIIFPGRAETGMELYCLDFEQGTVEQVTNLGGRNLSPSLTPDGQWISFLHFSQGYTTTDLYLLSVDFNQLFRVSNVPLIPFDLGSVAWEPQVN